MTVQLALVETDGVPFGLVVVPQALLDDPAERDRNHRFFEERLFRDLPVVMVGDDYRSAPRFFGRPDLTEFMHGVALDMIDWTTVDLPFTPTHVS